MTSDGLEIMTTTYHDDIIMDSLLVELPLLTEICKGSTIICFDDLHEHLMVITSEELNLIPNVVLVCMLLQINPATSATPERSFSLARRIMTWQRSTMTQKRFNSIALMHCHKTDTDMLDLVAVGNEFVAKHDQRKVQFGTFISSDNN